VLATAISFSVACSFQFDCTDKGKPVVKQGRKAVSVAAQVKLTGVEIV